MNPFVEFIVKHGYSFLFGVMFAHQIGLPIPGPLILLAAGALVMPGRLNLGDTLFLSVAACVVADWIWFEAGRQRGERVLRFVHRFAPDPKAADVRARKHFRKYGPAILVIAKFVPGVDAVAPPMAGTSGTSRSRFLALDALGASLYCAVYTAVGCVFSHDLDRAAVYVSRAGRVMLSCVFAALIFYAAGKFLRVRRTIDASRSVNITADDLTAQ